MLFPIFNTFTDWEQTLVLDNRRVTGGGCCSFVLDVTTVELCVIITVLLYSRFQHYLCHF